MMKRFLQFGLVLTVAAALPNSSFGQAMVGYGINVARAGAAGVAGGAGTAGVFSKLISRTQQTEQPPSGVARGRQPDFGEDDLKPTVIKLKTGAKPGASATSGRRKMSSGVTISGIPASSASSARSGTAAVREVGLSDSAAAGFDTGSGYAPAAPAPYRPASVAGAGGQSATAAVPEPAKNEPSTETAKNEAVPGTPVTASAGFSTRGRSGPAPASVLAAPRNSPGTASGPAYLGDDDDALAEFEISVGDAVEKIIARFGNPLMVLKGISGQDYTEKYLFRTEDGSRITVLALNGTVTAVLTSAKPLAARAALR